MGYLSKELIEKCYLTMYDIAPSSAASDRRVQIVSALRYWVCIDMFEKIYGRHCDGNKKSSDKSKFYEIVASVVAIKDDYYVANFADLINPKGNQNYNTSNNLFGSPIFRKSNNNPQVLPCPDNQKKFPLFDLQNCVLIKNVDYYKNINHYLPSQDTKIAFSLWLIRNESIPSLSYDSIIRALKEKCSDELVSSLSLEENAFNSYVNGSLLEENIAEVSAESLLEVYHTNHNDVVSSMDYDALKEKIGKKLDKGELTDILASFFSSVNASAAGGIFTFMLGEQVVNIYKATELMAEANKKNPKALFRYNAELSAAFEMYRFFKEHPELIYFNHQRTTYAIESSITDPLQKIVYGAPGTGKSFSIDDIIKTKYQSKEDEKEHVFRTTFHPDSDYSTFVGCYKPTKENSANYKSKLLSKEELVERLKEYRNLYEETQAQTQFGFDFYESLRFRSDTNEILKQAAGKTFDTCIRVGMAIAERSTPKSSGNITYDFVPQSFTKAYIKAWEEKLLAEYGKKDDEQKATVLQTENGEAKKVKAKPVYLVIEEINRGNCAQIFGDLFQLLDRNDSGMSCYPIKPDTDLGNYIAGELRKFTQEHNIDIDATGYKEIINGEEMLLPNNLYIWATMNTSDQSLFPIDSAFKRRWDWEYVPISEGYDREKGNTIKNTIKIGDYECDWWQFIQAINKEIGTTTMSEDKKLGFFFCKADKNIIDKEKFVGKVIFYLWNDVFKDYETDLFDISDDFEKPMFEMFYKSVNGRTSVDEDIVKKFIDNLRSKHPEIFSTTIQAENGLSE